METAQLKKIIEALLFVSEKPLTVEKISAVTEEKDKALLEKCIEDLGEDYRQQQKIIQIQPIAGGYQLSTTEEVSPWVKKLLKDKLTLKLSPSALETLSIVAYRQPITRAEIESIRGVEVSAILGKLLERKIIRICGRKEAPGRPLLYSTTDEFLRYFGLKNLSEIPALEEISVTSESET
ncbi:MAG: SMC-Scp complex subunit ScpB [Elusimicrobiota bacterium]